MLRVPERPEILAESPVSIAHAWIPAASDLAGRPTPDCRTQVRFLDINNRSDLSTAHVAEPGEPRAAVRRHGPDAPDGAM
ncbi:MAG: hypothetical protein Kow0062_23830 [Acidobacteriota bacterium]